MKIKINIVTKHLLFNIISITKLIYQYGIDIESFNYIDSMLIKLCLITLRIKPLCLCIYKINVIIMGKLTY